MSLERVADLAIHLFHTALESAAIVPRALHDIVHHKPVPREHAIPLAKQVRCLLADAALLSRHGVLEPHDLRRQLLRHSKPLRHCLSTVRALAAKRLRVVS